MLIDIEVESDMKQVLTVMHNEFKLLNSKFDTKFEHVESRISTGYTFFGIALGVISAVLAILGIMVAMLVFKK